KIGHCNTYKEYYISGIIIVDDVSEHNIEGIPVVAGKEDALSYMQNHQVDRVYIDLERDSKAGKELLKGCNEMGITVHYVLSPNSIDGKSVIEQIGNSMVVTSSLRFASSRDLMLKRIMDIVGGIVGCILTGILTVIIGPIIYVQSPGPIFFSQKRVGQNGRIFRIYKFRSMYPDAEERKKELMEQNKMKGHMFKMDNDPRIIPIGHFIRKTSLDEFPQFWNVLKGDMSLVGTRPPTVDEYEKYERHHKARLATKPGLTGMWQVTGRSDIVDFEEVVQLDMNYIQEWNLGLDIKIIFKTVKNMFTGKGSV
ncbi:MAG: sugar transferase, partial [Frisingicoccus sp.]|uniref:sugar transferase n=1 Tax=Frisingicoccus sp. TaxID=1918627 RepID=UPI00260DEC5B